MQNRFHLMESAWFWYLALGLVVYAIFANPKVSQRVIPPLV